MERCSMLCVYVCVCDDFFFLSLVVVVVKGFRELVVRIGLCGRCAGGLGWRRRLAGHR